MNPLNMGIIAAKWIFSLFLIFAGCICGLLFYVIAVSPDVSKIKDCVTTRTTKVLVCEQNPDYVPLNAISPYLVDSIVVSEDAKFYEHDGFDMEEIYRSFITNIERMAYSRGGSTITQQLVKNFYLSNEKSFTRKLTEAYITMHVENQLTKDQILEKYLNMIELGPNIYGIRKASQHYFGKEPLNLTLLESVSLAYLLPNPKLYSRVFQTGELTKFATWRHEGILKSLKLHRRISNEVYALAMSEVQNFPNFSPIIPTEDSFVNEEITAEPAQPVFPKPTEKGKSINISELEPGQQIESINALTAQSDELFFIETHLNNDQKKDTILVDSHSGESSRSQAFLFLNKENHYLFIGTVWINPSQFHIENKSSNEFSSIFTFIPGDSESGDLIEYQYRNGYYSMKAEIILREEAKAIFKDSGLQEVNEI
mgnify:CR=1 FL=1